MIEETKSDFEQYVEKYCKTYRISPEEAKKHKIVQNVKEYYKNR